MSTVLLRDVRLPGSPADAVALEDDRIVWVGRAADTAAYDAAEQVWDGDGALLLPAFVDAHLHAVQTGFLLTQLDLRAASSLEDALDRIAAFARQRSADAPDDVLVGTGWDDSTWPQRRPPTAAEVERAAPGRRVLLTRLDGHSAVLSPALMDRIDGLADQHGYAATGHMTLDAMAHTVAAVAGLIGPDQRLAAARAAMLDLAEHGVAGFHEAAAPHIGPAYEIALVRQAAAEQGLVPTIYWGEYAGFEAARALQVHGLAGDLNADGSIGSRTAAMHTAYADRPGHTGHAYLDAAAIRDHLVACTRQGIQGGFHCIGDAGLHAVTTGFRAAEEVLGAAALRQARHRLEHVEMPTAETIAMMAELGVVASMQPLFDQLWGGPDQMYAERLGERWRGMNPIGALHRAGVRVALGSDAPVTEPRPWSAIRAACRHHEPDQRIDPGTAMTLHTVGGWHAAGVDDAGRIARGQQAHLALWGADALDPETGLPDLDSPPDLHRLIVSGRTVIAA